MCFRYNDRWIIHGIVHSPITGFMQNGQECFMSH
jgi:hypothetical protein